MGTFTQVMQPERVFRHANGEPRRRRPYVAAERIRASMKGVVHLNILAQAFTYCAHPGQASQCHGAMAVMRASDVAQE